MSILDCENRVVSGMRPTGRLHLGHYHGVLKNWLRMQQDLDCWFFVADWHALTTHYDKAENLGEHTLNTVVDWLASGVSPSLTRIFVQSQVPEHAELHLLLSMITPLGWLQRVPSYKDAASKPDSKARLTYGFLGYPLLQSADVLIYRAGKVPVGADQVSHIEFARELASRFNHLFGGEDDFLEQARRAAAGGGEEFAEVYWRCRRRFLEKGDREALLAGKTMLDERPEIPDEDRILLRSALEGDCRIILPAPEAYLTETPKIPGINGEKMSKSLHNAIDLRDTDEEISQKIRGMVTDPARKRRTDPGDPEKCPVWNLHQVYSDKERQSWVREGCTNASIGCIDCKKPLINAMQEEIAPIRENAHAYGKKPDIVRDIIADGSKQARSAAEETLHAVRTAMKI